MHHGQICCNAFSLVLMVTVWQVRTCKATSTDATCLLIDGVLNHFLCMYHLNEPIKPCTY